MTTLYRKYRPQTFADLVGQEHIVQTIENEVALGKVAHAYLFSGPRGVGKTTLARLLAKAVNCANRKDGKFEPCDKCSSCAEIAVGRNIDVIEMDAATHTQVDKIRENIIQNITFRPTSSKYKVYIIDEVHMLSTPSFNALLKTLEEPPAHVIFILATTEMHKLPSTVVSRCQRFQFKKIPYSIMQARLKTICSAEDIKVEKEVLDRIIKKSDGCLRDAESLLGQLFSLNLGKITSADAELVLPSSNVDDVMDYLENILKNDPASAITTIAKAVEAGTPMDQFGLDLLELLRAIMVLQATNDTNAVNVDFSESSLKRMRALISRISPASLVRLIDKAIERGRETKSSPLPQLPLELFAVEMAGITEGISTTTTAHPATAIPSPSATLGVNSAEGSRPKNTRGSPTPLPAVASVGMTTSNTPIAKTEPDPKPHPITGAIKAAVSAITGNHPPKTTLAEVEVKWPELVKAISNQNHALTFILSMASLSEVKSDGLHLSVPYSIHKDKIEEHKNKKIIEECLEAAFGEKIRLTCDLIKKAKEEKTSDTELAGLALEFGGEVVN